MFARYLRAFIASGLLLLLPGQEAFAVGVPGIPTAYQSRVVKNCTGSTSCSLNFARVTNGKVLKATNINCFAHLGGDHDSAVFVLFFGAFNQDRVLNYFQVDDIDNILFTLNEPILSFVEGGKRPKLSVSGLPGVNTNKTVICNLSGDLLKP